MSRKRLAIATIVLLLAVGALSIVVFLLRPNHALMNASVAPMIGKASLGGTAPEFQAATTDGPFDLNQIQEPVFLEIFATWCPHCQRESAVIDKLYDKYGSKVAFIGVSGSDTAMDGTTAASQSDMLAWVQKFNVRYPVAYDPNPDSGVASLYLQGGFPTIAVIDKSKKIVYLNSGEIAYDELAAAIEKALAEN